jgi:hypothetical protein
LPAIQKDFDAADPWEDKSALKRLTTQRVLRLNVDAFGRTICNYNLVKGILDSARPTPSYLYNPRRYCAVNRRKSNKTFVFPAFPSHLLLLLEHLIILEL